MALAIGTLVSMAAMPAVHAAPYDIAIIVTNVNYDGPVGKADYAENDGKAVAMAMSHVLKVENIRSYKDQTRSNLDVLFGPKNHPEQGELWRSVTNPKARVYVYYSGHGAPHLPADSGRPEAYLMTRDANPDYLPLTAYALQTLRENLTALKNAKLPEGEVILILEACFSGRTGANKPLRPGTSESAMSFDFGRASGIIEIAAAESNQVAFWDQRSKLGMFTDLFLWGLHGEADKPDAGGNGDGKITLSELSTYVNRRLPDRLTIHGLNAKQAAVFAGADGRVIADVDGGPLRRQDMIEVESDERAYCRALQTGEDIAGIDKFLGSCVACRCRGDLLSRRSAIEAEQRACRNVETQLQTQQSASVLRAFAETTECERLKPALKARAALLEQNAQCAEDEARWAAAVREGPIEKMKSVVAVLTCPRVLEGARAELERREGIERLAKAADLGALADNQLIERRDHVGGANLANVWKFRLASSDTVEVWLDGLTDNLDIDLRDATDRVIASSRQGGTTAEKIESPKLDPGTYYLLIVPADRERASSYVLRLAKGTVDTAGDTQETARDLGALAPGELRILEHVGGSDRADFFKLTTDERLLLRVTVGNMTSNVDLELINRIGQVMAASRRPGLEHESIDFVVTPRAPYYVAVRGAAERSPYSLVLALSRIPPFSRREVAASATIGPKPSTLTHSLNSTIAGNYYAQFRLKESTPVAIDLSWSDAAADLDLLLENEMGETIARSGAARSTTGKVAQTLAAGNYYVRVSRQSGRAAATTPFTLTLRDATR
jgi:Bacterial pre-peptidase C-terminal domain